MSKNSIPSTKISPEELMSQKPQEYKNITSTESRTLKKPQVLKVDTADTAVDNLGLDGCENWGVEG